MSQSNKCREQLAEMFLHCLEEEKLPWHAVWDTSPQQNAISGKAYRGINAFTLTLTAWTRGCEDPRWCTFEQGKKAGWHLKKGSKGVPIEFWSLMHRKTHQVVDFKTAQEAIQKGEAVRDDYSYYCRVYHVFNGGDFEGIPEYRPESRGKPDLDQIRSHRDTLLRNMKVNFQWDGSGCYYSPKTDTITMPPKSAFHDTYGYVCSFLHEAGHATGHESRLNRPMGSTKEEYAIEELRAEIASAMTAQQLGISRLRKEMGKHSVYRPGKYTPLASVQSHKRQQEFVLPGSAKPAQRVFQYLEKSRRIHPKVISEMLNAKLLYQEAAHFNCVFASPDYDGVIKNCSMRASNDTRFFKESGEKLGWMVNPHRRALFVCEAPIDAMSIMSLLQYGGKDFMDYSYYAQCGMPRKGSLGYHLEHNPEVQTIYLCYDNDEAGRVFTERAQKELQEAGFTGKLVVKSPVAKDFNDDLKALLAHRQPVQPPAEMEGTLCMKP